MRVTQRGEGEERSENDGEWEGKLWEGVEGKGRKKAVRKTQGK
jgi:hypothetical protein